MKRSVCSAWGKRKVGHAATVRRAITDENGECGRDCVLGIVGEVDFGFRGADFQEHAAFLFEKINL